MKKAIFLLLLLNFSACLFAQDIIITKEDERIEAKIITVYDAVVKYALFNDPNGPTTLILKSKLKSITYENGQVENFENFKSAKEVSKIDRKFFKNVIRINPLVTVIGAIQGAGEIEIQYARYIAPKLAIPISVDLYTSDLGSGVALLTGLEGVPLPYRQQCGLFLNGLIGIMILEQGSGFLANANLGYQLMTKHGFALNIAGGPEYNTITHKVRFKLMLDFGIAF